jgi:hypothetical protein
MLRAGRGGNFFAINNKIKGFLFSSKGQNWPMTYTAPSSVTADFSPGEEAVCV